jgi:hypothetical protein
MISIQKIRRLFHTIRHLRTRQIRYQVWYRIKKVLPSRPARPVSDINAEPLSFSEFIYKPESFKDNTFTFLNVSKDYRSLSEINWDEKSSGKLWAYNLNYFDYLLQPRFDEDTGILLIENYIERFSELSVAKEPYPISLRCMNWIKFMARCKTVNTRFTSQLNNSLYNQYLRLCKHIEYHLMGNHLLENAFSLLFGAFYFSDRSFYSKARKVLFVELNEQILNDGGHFELSPMYHQLMLERVLDCVNLLMNNSRFQKQDDLLSLLRSKASVMAGWLSQISFANLSTPLVNDASTGIAPSSSDLLKYAESMGIGVNAQPLSDSGYRVFKGKHFELLVDYGVPGPDYLPGHAHSDIFNFVLYAFGNPIIIDTGTSTYDAGEIRDRERSTAAHNTVSVNGKEQSETWAAFRMGRRAKPLVISDKPDYISGYHSAFKPNIHEREFRITDDTIIVTDRISGPDHKATAHIHFAPDEQVNLFNNSILSDHCKLIISENTQIQLEQYECALGFNQRQSATVVKIIFSRFLETKFEFLNN